MVIKNVSGKLIWLLIVNLVLSIVSLSTYTWGRYIFFLVAIATGLIYTILFDGKFRVKFDIFQIILIIFAVYAGVSSLWAMNASDSFSKMVTILSIVFCFYPIYAYYRDYGDVEQLISGIKWGETFVCIYTIIFVGLNSLIIAASSDRYRIANDFANANTLGLCASTVIYLQTWQLMFSKGKKWELICCLPALIVMGASQSRKSIVFLLAAVFILYFLRYGEEKKPFKTLFIFISAVAIAIGLFYIASNLEIFSGLFERMSGLINSLTGAGKVDHSTELRHAMRNLGIEWWLKRPLFGVGIGNPHILTQQYLGTDAYLHNNFVEILCGGGLIGFILFYSMHVYSILKIIKLRHIDKSLFALAISWCILMLIMDYGMVSYYSKLDLFYLMTVFLIIEQMKYKQNNEMMEIV